LRRRRPFGLQHGEREAALDRQPALLRRLTRDRFTWAKEVREIDDDMDLHPSVMKRLSATAVPQMGEVKRYRPPNLRSHPRTCHFYDAGLQG
jgi:hypothetical protein